MLITGITKVLFGNINNDFCRHKGTVAFQYLDQAITGSEPNRRDECDMDLRAIFYKWGDDPQEHVNRLLNLFSEAEKLGIFADGSSPKPILNDIARRLPKELAEFQSSIQRRCLDRGDRLTIAEYTLEFKREVERIPANIRERARYESSVNMAAVRPQKKKIWKKKKKLIPDTPGRPYNPKTVPNPSSQSFQGGGSTASWSSSYNGNRGGRGSWKRGSQRGRGRGRGYSERQNNFTPSRGQQGDPTCTKCGTSRDGHTAAECRSGCIPCNT